MVAETHWGEQQLHGANDKGALKKEIQITKQRLSDDKLGTSSNFRATRQIKNTKLNVHKGI